MSDPLHDRKVYACRSCRRLFSIPNGWVFVVSRPTCHVCHEPSKEAPYVARPAEGGDGQG